MMKIKGNRNTWQKKHIVNTLELPPQKNFTNHVFRDSYVLLRGAKLPQPPLPT